MNRNRFLCHSISNKTSEYAPRVERNNRYCMQNNRRRIIREPLLTKFRLSWRMIVVNFIVNYNTLKLKWIAEVPLSTWEIRAWISETYNARVSRMRQNVGVALHDMFSGERPMRLGGPSVMIIQKGHRLLRPVPNHPRRLVIRVPKTPQLPVHCFLQNTFSGEIKRCRPVPCRMHPIDQLLSMAVLVVIQTIASVLHVRPKLTNRKSWSRVLHVPANEVASVPLSEVEPPPIKPYQMFQPAHPRDQFALYAIVRVIDVGRGAKIVTSVRCTCSRVKM